MTCFTDIVNCYGAAVDSDITIKSIKKEHTLSNRIIIIVSSGSLLTIFFIFRDKCIGLSGTSSRVG